MNSKKETLKKQILTATFLLFAISCAKISDDAVVDSNINVMVTAVNQVASIASSNEGVPVAMQTLAQAAAACSHSGFFCAGTLRAVDWNSCTAGTATMSGGWTESYNSGACCSSFTNGCSMSRITSPTGSTITFASGATLITSSENHTAYDGTAINGAANSISSVKGGGGDRTIAINGLRRILRGPKGTTWFNHSVVTSTPINITGAKVISQSRIINFGTVDVYHNIAGYKASTTFSPTTRVTWANPNCCHPTSGIITTVFNGSKAGTATLTFNSTSCGAATLVDTDGSSYDTTFDQCE